MKYHVYQRIVFGKVKPNEQSDAPSQETVLVKKRSNEAPDSVIEFFENFHDLKTSRLVK